MKDQDDNVIPLPEEAEESFTHKWLAKGSELYEGLGFALFRRFVNSTMNGWYVYNQNSGSLNVGAATFFGLLSVIPVLSCSIFVLGLFYGSSSIAHAQFFMELKGVMPPVSHVLLEEVSRLTLGHIQSTPLSVFNAFILIWTAKGFFGNLTVGLLKVTNTKNTGGQFMETVRALASEMAFCGILFLCLELSEKGSLVRLMQNGFHQFPMVQEAIASMARYQLFTVPSTVALISVLFKWHLKTPLHTCIEGAFTFIAGFFALKSFYWIYLHYNQAETTSLYGAFAPMVIGVLWGYFMLTAFYIGACVASLPRQKAVLSKIPKVEDSWNEAA